MEADPCSVNVEPCPSHCLTLAPFSPEGVVTLLTAVTLVCPRLQNFTPLLFFLISRLTVWQVLLKQLTPCWVKKIPHKQLRHTSCPRMPPWADTALATPIEWGHGKERQATSLLPLQKALYSRTDYSLLGTMSTRVRRHGRGHASRPFSKIKSSLVVTDYRLGLSTGSQSWTKGLLSQVSSTNWLWL